eukprot:Hpha_TRINITY_DN2311_c0_g1::TRINITY_DN2311_c0_g1_i1::g.410::m.410
MPLPVAAVLGAKAGIAAKSHAWVSVAVPKASGAAHASLGGVKAHSGGTVGAAAPAPAAAAGAAPPAPAAPAPPAPAPAAAAAPAGGGTGGGTATWSTGGDSLLWSMMVGGMGGAIGGLVCGGVAAGVAMFTLKKAGVDRQKEAVCGTALASGCGCLCGSILCAGNCGAACCWGGLPGCCIGPIPVVCGYSLDSMSVLARTQAWAEVKIVQDLVEHLQRGQQGLSEVEGLIKDQMGSAGLEAKILATYEDPRYDQLRDERGVDLWVQDYFDCFVEHVAPALLMPISAAAAGGEQAGGKMNPTEGASVAAEGTKKRLEAMKAQRSELIQKWSKVLRDGGQGVTYETLRVSFLGTNQSGDRRCIRWYAVTHSALFADTPLSRHVGDCAVQ